VENELKMENDTESLEKIIKIEQQKKLIIESEFEDKMEIQTEFNQKKQQIRNKFRAIVNRVILEKKKFSKEMEKNKTEIKRTESIQKQIEMEIDQIFETKMKIQDPSERKKESKSNEDVIIDGKQNQTNYKMETESSDSSGISDYQEQSSNESSEELSFTNGAIEIPDSFARENLELDDLVVDFNEDELINKNIIEEYETEVLNDPSKPETSSLDLSKIDDNIEIINDRKKAENNTNLILKHEMIGNLLNIASLKVEVREATKLARVNDILQAKQELIEMIDANNDGQESQIEELKVKIAQMIDDLVKDFGEGELLTLNDNGITHYTVGDFKEDLSFDEFKYIFKKPSLKEADQNMLFI
jgi:hypothetical protein